MLHQSWSTGWNEIDVTESNFSSVIWDLQVTILLPEKLQLNYIICSFVDMQVKIIQI